MTEVINKSYDYAPVNLSEAARYAGAKKDDKTISDLIESCAKECESLSAVRYCACYAETPVFISGNEIDFSAFTVKSKDLAKVLHGADRALIFACTIGIGIDRLISKYSQINPSRALIMQAFGAERTETFTDLFLSEYALKENVSLMPRFSPGYGDLPLETQKDIFAFLSPQKSLGLTLNESLLMSPSKSVTAIIGVKKGRAEKPPLNNCTECAKKDCEYRR